MVITQIYHQVGLKGGNSADDAELRNGNNGNNNDSYSPNGGRFAVALGPTGYFCKSINATGYTNLAMSYYWRGDSNANNDDEGVVEYKLGGGDCSTGSWPDLQEHVLNNHASWTTQTSFSLPVELNNSTFNIKFRNRSNQNTEDFRVDGIVITGKPIVTTGSLTINKNVLNPDDFEVIDNQSFGITLNGANPQNISENSSYTYTNLTPGTYTIVENANANYDFVSFSSDSDNMTAGAQVVVSAGNNTVLTITNKQKKGTLTVNKVVTNPNGGEAVAGDFSFQVNGGGETSFIQDENNPLLGSNTLNLNPGNYTISEVIPEGNYAISYNNCTNIALASNGSATCTITNSDIPEGQGAITVVKNINFNYAGTLTAGDFDLFIGETEVVSGKSNFLSPGSYTITEGSLPFGYTQNSISCTDGMTTTSGTVELTEQTSWICTITNSDMPASLKIVKNLVNSAFYKTLVETFNFTVSGQENNLAIETNPVEQEGINASGEYTLSNLSKGNYNISELLHPNWNLTDINCTKEGSLINEGSGISVAIDNGEDVVCTFTNERKVGTLIVEKVVVNDDGKELNISDFPGFTINNSEPIPFEANEDNMSGGKTVILELGAYQISEPVTEGYYKVTENCDIVNIIEGETKTCKFRNDDVGAFVHSGGSGGGGQVLGATTENTSTTTEENKEEPKTEGEVLGDSTENACTPYLTKFMRLKAKNDKNEVILLQKFLNEHLALNPKIKEDGFFGPKTRDAVIAFQEKHKDEILKPWIPFGLTGERGTGNVFKTTLRMINMTKCPNTTIPMPQLP